MWKRYDAFRNWVIRKTEENGFWKPFLVILSIPAAGMLVDHYLGLKIFGPGIIFTYALIGIMANIRDLQESRARYRREQHEWNMKNLPPYDGF